MGRLRNGPTAAIPSLTALARHAGYADMPHLSRELRLHFGGAPREIARQLNPDWVKRVSEAPPRVTFAQRGGVAVDDADGSTAEVALVVVSLSNRGALPRRGSAGR